MVKVDRINLSDYPGLISESLSEGVSYLSTKELTPDQISYLTEYYGLVNKEDSIVANSELSITDLGESNYLITSPILNYHYRIDSLVDLLEYKRSTIMTRAKTDTPERVKRSKNYQSLITPYNFEEDDFLKTGDLTYYYRVKDYTVVVSFINALEYIKNDIYNNKKPLDNYRYQDFRAIIAKVIKSCEINISCSCPDQSYRFNYRASLNDYKYGDKETRPAKITNPGNKGSTCKHVHAVLDNNVWIYKMVPQTGRFIKSHRDVFTQSIDEVIEDEVEVPEEGDTID